MPELPEVETVKRGLEPHLVGQKIKQIKVHQQQLRWPITEGIEKFLPGLHITQLRRRAKYLLFDTPNGSLITHLGMSGIFRIFERPYSSLQKHDHLEIEFDHCLLRYNDPRRFGAILWTSDDPLQHLLLSKLGPEPLSHEFDAKHLYTLSRRTKKPIKNFIMDNAIVVGVGNIYASESLFKAKIHPLMPTHKLSKDQAESLTASIKETLSNAIQQGGTTLKDFKNSEGKPGYFQQSLFVYGRKDQPCLSCCTPIQSMVIGQRNTFFCANCQKK